MDNIPLSSEEQETKWMRRAIELARRGAGQVEPNPMVGCVLVQEGEIIGEGWHQELGQAHAEINALNQCSRPIEGATAYVTLEPCCHHGKTPPCTDALIKAGVKRVVIAQRDPYEQVAGQGILALQQAGIDIEVGLLENEALNLNAPYLHRIHQRLPWLIAKWAMTLDGRIATRTGDSQWISNKTSRKKVHEIRSCVDAIMVGIGTALADDPLLTPRPPGKRSPVRIVVDSSAQLPLDSKLVTTTHEHPCLVAVGPQAEEGRCKKLESHGCEIWRGTSNAPNQRLKQLMNELAERGMTNILVEGGGRLLGSLFDQKMICEAHAFIAPKIVGGSDAIPPISGTGIDQLVDSVGFSQTHIENLDGDIHIWGRLLR